MLRQPLRSTLFPYTTLFRSVFNISLMSVPDALMAGIIPKIRPVNNEMSNVNPRTRASKERSIEPSRRRSEEHTSELQSRRDLVCRLLLEKKKHKEIQNTKNK